MEIRKRCKGCRHWDHLEFDQGTCFYNPPAVTEGHGAVWPIVNQDGRCSKWCPEGVPFNRDERLVELERCYDRLSRTVAGGGQGSESSPLEKVRLLERHLDYERQRINSLRDSHMPLLERVAILEKVCDALQERLNALEGQVPSHSHSWLDPLLERVATLEKKVARGDDLWREGSRFWEMWPRSSLGVDGLELTGIVVDELMMMKEGHDENDRYREAGETEQSEESQGEEGGGTLGEPEGVSSSSQEGGAAESSRRHEEETREPEAEGAKDVPGAVRGVAAPQPEVSFVDFLCPHCGGTVAYLPGRRDVDAE